MHLINKVFQLAWVILKWIDSLVKLNKVRIFPFLNPYLPEFSDPPIPKICDPVHYSQSSREKVTPSSGTSPLAYY